MRQYYSFLPEIPKDGIFFILSQLFSFPAQYMASN